MHEGDCITTFEVQQIARVYTVEPTYDYTKGYTVELTYEDKEALKMTVEQTYEDQEALQVFTVELMRTKKL